MFRLEQIWVGRGWSSGLGRGCSLANARCRTRKRGHSAGTGRSGSGNCTVPTARACSSGTCKNCCLHLLGPFGQPLVLRVFLLQLVDVPQEMGPTPLVQPLMHVVSTVEVTDQHPFKLVSQHLLNHLAAPAGPAEEVTHFRIAEAPEIPVAAIFPPACFVPVHHRTGSYLLPQPVVLLLTALRRSPHQRCQFTNAEAQAIAPLQVALNQPKGEPQLLPEHAHFALH